MTPVDDNEQRKSEPFEAEAKEAEDFALLPSTLPDIGVDLHGFATEEMAKAVGEAVHSWLHAFGKFLNLKRLLRIIVAYNYEEALAGIDRGTAAGKPLAATNDEIAVGIA